jgi:hypothetical protein
MGIRRKPEPVRVDNTVAPAELDVTVDRARIALAVTVIDENLRLGRGDAHRLYQALLEVRHALAPGMRPLDPPVPVIPGRAS